MMKNISRRSFLKVAGSGAAIAALTACAGSSASNGASADTGLDGASGELSKYKIGIGEVKTDDQAQIRVEYFQNYIGEHYGTEFWISEKISDGDQEMTAIESAATAGCDGFISYQNLYMLASCQKAQQEGLYYSANSVPDAGGAPECIQANLPNFAGTFGQNQPGTGALIREYLEGHASSDGSEGFFLITGYASRNNQQHSQVTLQALQALQELYGLKYTDIENGTAADLTALAQTDQPGEIANDKGINIYILPGIWTDNDTWLPSASSALQTGKYLTIISCDAVYTVLAQTMDEIERSLNKNITFICVSPVNDTLVDVLTKKDSFGNNTIDFVACAPQTINDGAAYCQMMNTLCGGQDNMRNADGTMGSILSPRVGIANEEEMNELAQWDMLETKIWAGSYSYLDQMLYVNDNTITIDKIQEFNDTLVTTEALAALMD